MKLWREAHTAAEQEALVEAALAATRDHATGRDNVTRAAELLGITRRHLTRWRAETRRLRRIHGLTETARLSETGETSSLTGTDEAGEMRSGTETLSKRKQLTYASGGSTFSTVATATAEHRTDAVTDDPAPKKSITVEIPLELYQWVEREALRRKHLGFTNRMAMGPIVIEALERHRRKTDGGGGDDNND